MKDSKLLWGEREGWALVGAMPPLPQPLTFVATSWMVQFSSLMCSWINVIIWAFAYLCTYPLSPSPPLPLVISRLLWGRCAVAQVLILIRLLTEKLWWLQSRLEGKKLNLYRSKSVNCTLYICRWSIYSWPNWYFFILLLVHVYQKQEIPILVELLASNIFAFTYSATVLTHKLFFNKILCM